MTCGWRLAGATFRKGDVSDIILGTPDTTLHLRLQKGKTIFGFWNFVVKLLWVWWSLRKQSRPQETQASAASQSAKGKTISIFLDLTNVCTCQKRHLRHLLLGQNLRLKSQVGNSGTSFPVTSKHPKVTKVVFNCSTIYNNHKLLKTLWWKRRAKRFIFLSLRTLGQKILLFFAENSKFSQRFSCPKN